MGGGGWADSKFRLFIIELGPQIEQMDKQTNRQARPIMWPMMWMS